MKESRPLYKRKRYLLFALIVIGIIYVGYSIVAPGSHDELAKCLGEKGATMYGAYWCPHCNNQKAAFGKSFQFINYVECSQQEALCEQMNVTGLPTWIIGGRHLEGEQTFETLAEAAGCDLSS